MKLSILALGAASASILSVAPCFAQLQIGSSAPADLNPPTRLVAQSGSMPDNPFTSGGLTGVFSTARDAIGLGANPPASDDPLSTQAEIDDPQALVGSNRPVATEQAPPSGTPTALTHPQLFTAPHVNDGPLVWPVGQRGVLNPYNPTATMMLQNWCTEGLWDSYAAQRARECALIQAALSGQTYGACGRHGCGLHSCGLGHCGAGHCGCGGCGAAHGCHLNHARINRYMAPSAGCLGSGCAAPACGAAGCDSVPYAGQPMGLMEAPVSQSPMVQSGPTPAPIQNGSVQQPVGSGAPNSILSPISANQTFRAPGNLQPPPPARRPGVAAVPAQRPATPQQPSIAAGSSAFSFR